MPRPTKFRVVCTYPEANYFKPAGVSLKTIEQIVLGLDEYEAISLADLEGMTQEEAARFMNVSRQTFGRIIASAHKKIADALVCGKALKIKGGKCIMSDREFECSSCGSKWEEPFGKGKPEECPSCCKDDFKRIDSHKCQGNHSSEKGHCCGKGKESKTK